MSMSVQASLSVPFCLLEKWNRNSKVANAGLGERPQLPVHFCLEGQILVIRGLSGSFPKDSQATLLPPKSLKTKTRKAVAFCGLASTKISIGWQ